MLINLKNSEAHCIGILLNAMFSVKWWGGGGGGSGGEERKEGNVLFKNALNTFYLQLYEVRHMVTGPLNEETRYRHCMGYSF